MFSPDGASIVSGSYDATIRVWDTKSGKIVIDPLEEDGAVISVAMSHDGARILSGSSNKTLHVWDEQSGQLLLGPLEGHVGLVTSVAFSSDGSRLISGSCDGTIRMWDAQSGNNILGSLKGHTAVVNSVAFSADGTRIATGSDDHTIRVWDAYSKRQLLDPLEGHTDRVRSVVFSPSGALIVSGSNDHTIRVWDARNGKTTLDPLQGHTSLVLCVAVSPCSAYILSGSRDRTICVWDARSGTHIRRMLQGHNGSVLAVAYSPNGINVVSGSTDNAICIWDVRNGQLVFGPLKKHTNWVRSVSFSPDGNRIVSGSSDSTLLVWDAQSGQSVLGPLLGHTDSVTAVSFSGDGSLITSGSRDKAVRVWDAGSGQVALGPLEGHTELVTSVAFSPDGTSIISASEDHTVIMWDAQNSQAALGSPEGHTDWVRSVAFSPDGFYIASGSNDNSIRMWDARSGQPVLVQFYGHTEPVLSIAFSPDATRLVSGSDDSTIRVWDVRTGRTILGPLTRHTDSVRSVAFSPDGTRIASGSSDKRICLWDAGSGELLFRRLKGHTDQVRAVAFSPDGACIASGSDDATIRTWDVQSGRKLLDPFTGHKDWVTSVSYSPDNTRIVSGSGDKSICVWDARSGQLILGPLKGHTGLVTSVAFSPNSTLIVSGSKDKTIRVWDVRSGQTVLGPLEGHTGSVRSAAFSPDGNCIVSGSNDRAIIMWDARTEGVMAQSFGPPSWKIQDDGVMPDIAVSSPDIVRASLHRSIPVLWHAYALPFLSLWPLLAYAYYVRYDDWIKSEEWSFVFTVGLGAAHALSFLSTRWSAGIRAWVTTRSVSSLEAADCIRIVPSEHRGQGEIVSLIRKPSPHHPSESEFAFVYQRDTYIYDPTKKAFAPLPYPCNDKPLLTSFEGTPTGLATTKAKTQSDAGTIEALTALYGKNEFDIPIPSFVALFAEHTTAPFFVFQVFCVALWCLDEYWYYSLFTLFMLIVFECTVVFQRVSTLKEFRTMSVDPYPIYCYRDKKWVIIQSDTLLPGDVISISRNAASTEPKKHDTKPKEKKSDEDKDKETTTPDRSIPADALILRGTCIVNEAMLSGESTPLLKESLGVLSKEEGEKLDVDGQHKGCVLFGGTKILKAGEEEGEAVASSATPSIKTPDGGALALVLRTGFGTAQGQLVRTMIFSTERVSANNLESFLFIGFLLVFAIAASWYVWVKGIERGLKKSKLLLDCVLIITSVVPPELPMELSLAVNTSLAALSKFAIFCTEPFRIPVAGRVDVCCFDKTGTITAVDLVVEGVAGVDPSDPLRLVPLTEVSRDTTLCLAAAHALVKLDDGQVVGDPMEQTALKALDWDLKGRDGVVPNKGASPSNSILIRRRFQFSSALKRMATISTVGAGGKSLIAVKGAPETIKKMLATVPASYDDTFKWFTRRGSRVLALAMKEVAPISVDKVAQLKRDEIERDLVFVGFLVFHCPLKPDAVATLKMLADSSHRCVMITGDNPLTAVHVAREVEIVDRDALILDVKEGSTNETELVWRTVDESKIIPVNPSEPLDTSLFEEYDICITGAAMRQYERTPSWPILVQNTWVYARVSPSQKELILTTFRSLGFTTLMAGDGTNDVGALKQAHIGVALLDGTPEDLQKIAEHARNERIKKVYESQLKISSRFNQPPPPVPPAIAHLYKDVVVAQQKAAEDLKDKRKRNPMEKFDLESITNKLAEMDDENEPPKIKLGDASCAAPFTSKLSNVSAIAGIIRQGRCTLVANIQMYKILALNCLITAYSLSVLYLDGIKFGDYQVTINGMLMSPVEKLSRERPLGNIINLYVLLSILVQFAIHIVSLRYITGLSNSLEQRGEIDLDAKFEPSLLNTAIYLLGLSQQVSTFAINFQGRPFREGIRENPALYYGLLSASAVAFGGAMELVPEMNSWLQIVKMTFGFQVRLTLAMVLDFAGCWVVEVVCKHLFADLEPKPLVTRGRERREARRAIEEREAEMEKAKREMEELEKKGQ